MAQPPSEFAISMAAGLSAELGIPQAEPIDIFEFAVRELSDLSVGDELLIVKVDSIVQRSTGGFLFDGVGVTVTDTQMMWTYGSSYAVPKMALGFGFERADMLNPGATVTDGIPAHEAGMATALSREYSSERIALRRVELEAHGIRFGSRSSFSSTDSSGRTAGLAI